jgi:peptidoglycan/xylan/chitin deacetylase (PgdA/CDA1 family)
MQYIVRFLLKMMVLVIFCFCATAWAEDKPEVKQADDQVRVPVLAYHRFGPTATDGMMVKVSEFEAQLKWLKDNNYTVIPLRTLVNYIKGEGPPPPQKSVVITADDGHNTVLTYMQPLVKKYNVPVTLFIYPSAISNASYAMTWDQLKQLKESGLFDIQCHTYWHPNFNKDKKKMKSDEYQKMVQMQFVKSKEVLEKKMGTKVNLLAWPFGIYNDELETDAAKAGYVMAFSIDPRLACKTEKVMAQPRYLMVTGMGAKRFEEIVSGRAQGKGQPIQ